MRTVRTRGTWKPSGVAGAVLVSLPGKTLASKGGGEKEKWGEEGSEKNRGDEWKNKDENKAREAGKE